jgi:tetratricopeptide (TPR) repeat protein
MIDTQRGGNFCRAGGRLLQIGVFTLGTLVACFFVLFLPAVHAQTSAASSDWSDLTPPVLSTDTNFDNGNHDSDSDFDTTNSPANFTAGTSAAGTNYADVLVMAGYYKRTMQPQEAEPLLIGLLAQNVPENIQRSALFELGGVVRDENDLGRAQTIYSQFLNRWPDDIRVPEVYLRQGQIFRQMGLTELALGKFYTVMATAISLKNDQLAFYQKLVLETQVEIAETHYLMGHYVDAADFYKRLLQNTDPSLDRPQMEYRLIRSLAIIGHNDEAVGEAQTFLARYPNAGEVPEVRYYLAQALKSLGRDDEALQEVLMCLQQQQTNNDINPTAWLYWQKRVGNEIANGLYHEGNYVQALEIYVDLAQLDPSPSWQIPVFYQTGLAYEKLSQPQKASDTYKQILAEQTQVGTNATPGIQAVFNMAQWRINFLKWQQNAQSVDQALATAVANSNPTNSPPRPSP